MKWLREHLVETAVGAGVALLVSGIVAGTWYAIALDAKHERECKAKHGSWEVVDRTYIPPTMTAQYDGKGRLTGFSQTGGYWVNDYGCILPR